MQIPCQHSATRCLSVLQSASYKSTVLKNFLFPLYSHCEHKKKPHTAFKTHLTAYNFPIYPNFPHANSMPIRNLIFLVWYLHVFEWHSFCMYFLILHHSGSTKNKMSRKKYFSIIFFQYSFQPNKHKSNNNSALQEFQWL